VKTKLILLAVLGLIPALIASSPSSNSLVPSLSSLPSVRSRNPCSVSSAANRAVVDFGSPERRDSSEMPNVR